MAPTFKKLALGAVVVFLGLLGLTAVAAGAFAVWLANADLKPSLERMASDDLRRPVTIGAVAVDWGNPLAVELDDLRIANADWGSVPDMVRIGHLSALIDVRALLGGVLRYERLRVENAEIVLERDHAGIGNWKFAGSGGLTVVPKDRTQVPTLIDSALTDSLITYRTSSGRILRIALDRATARTAGENAPITLQADLAYDDVPAKIDATFESSIALRDASRPVGARFTITAKDAMVAFDGTMMEPLDFEGVHGEAKLKAPTINELLKLLGWDRTAKISLDLAGDLDRAGNDWSLAGGAGQLGNSAFTGTLALQENGRGQPDDISADLDMEALDIDALMSQAGHGQKTRQDIAALPLQADLTGLNLEVKLTSDAVTLARMRLPAAQFDGRLAGGEVTLRELSFALAGGTVNASGSLEQAEADGHLAITAFLTQSRAEELAQLLGAPAGEIRGRLEGGAALDMTGKTLGAALETARGAAIVTMNDGDVARDLIERVSADLRNLFREGEGRVPIACLLGVLTVEDGVGRLAPLRLKSREAVLEGAGSIDISERRLDLILKTESDTTGFFALDVPIAVRGPFKALRVTPEAGNEDRLNEGDRNAVAEALPAALRKLMGNNTCA